ncbi:MAG: hypothetical protein ACTSRD_04595, partial [Promethearchaeota archaeon]
KNPDYKEKMRETTLERAEDTGWREKLSTSAKKVWQNKDYREKQLNERRERANNPEWIEKMTEINQEINRNSETREKMSNSLTERWQDPKYREKQFSSKSDVKKEILDRKQFLQDIQDMKRTDLAQKYNMSEVTTNKKIQDMLGHHGVHTYSEARRYLENKNPKEVLKDINEKLSNKSERYQRTKEITDKKRFLQDIQKLKKSEIDYKYDMDGKTINRKIGRLFGDTGVKTYSEAKKYLKDKKIDEVLQDINKDMKEKKHEEKSPDDNKNGTQSNTNPNTP